MKRRQLFRGLFAAVMLVGIFLGCKKSKIKNNCCQNTLSVTPSTYNSDSVNIFIPNAFTPNADGINEVFRPSLQGITAINFMVFKGKNKQLFQTNNMNEGWDGTFKGKNDAGLYRYVIDLTTWHGQSLVVEGEFCALTDDYLEGNTLKHCEGCTFSDMIDPTFGYIYESQEGQRMCNWVSLVGVLVSGESIASNPDRIQRPA